MRKGTIITEDLAAYEVVTICDHLRRQTGSVAVECALTLPLLTLLVIGVMQVAFICIEGQLTTYATFMAARSQMVGGDYQEEAHQIVPWMNVNGNSQTVSLIGHHPIFNVGPLGNAYQMSADMSVYPHSQECTPTEDNPIHGGSGC